MANSSGKTAPAAGDAAAFRLTDLLGFQLRMAQTAMYRDFITSLKELDLTQKLTGVLILLEETPGCSQIALSNRLGADRATIMAMVDRLEERGLIRRTRSQIDRRRQELYLNEAGTAAVQRARELIAAHEARFRSLFSAAELDSLMTFLRRMHASG